MPHIRVLALALTLAVSLAPAVAPARARADEPAFTLTVRHHRFEPDTLEVPAGQRIILTVVNADPTPEEFESGPLKREKVVAGGKQIVLSVGPLKPGSYEFFGDFNPKSARGTIVAK